MAMLADGTVVSSSQEEVSEFYTDQRVTTPMYGLILTVTPSDRPENLSASMVGDQRGWRHECTVLVVDNNIQPNLILENVVIPPSEHSGIDDYHENLPRAVYKEPLTDKPTLEFFAGIDIAELDGEWCLVNFIGGNLNKAFIQNWYYHPSNRFDPATSGEVGLSQVDVNKNKYRKVSRVNGVETTITGEGDVYLSTGKAGSKVKIEKIGESIEPRFVEIAKGGSVQIDIKKNQQLEVNFNEQVEGMKAGSTSASQTREASLRHFNPNKATGKPGIRQTIRSFLRLFPFEQFFKTSLFNVYCQNSESSSGKEGTFAVLAEDQVQISQAESGENIATLNISDGEVTVTGKDGSSVMITDNQVIVSTSGGGNVWISGDSASINTAGGLALGAGSGALEPVLKGASYTTTENVVLTQLLALVTALNTVASAWSVPGLWTLTQADVVAAKAVVAAAGGLLVSIPEMILKNTTTHRSKIVSTV